MNSKHWITELPAVAAYAQARVGQGLRRIGRRPGCAQLGGGAKGGEIQNHGAMLSGRRLAVMAG